MKENINGVVYFITYTFVQDESLKALGILEPFGIVVVYLQKHDFEKNAIENFRPVSYTHLTLPTIYSV